MLKSCPILHALADEPSAMISFIISSLERGPGLAVPSISTIRLSALTCLHFRSVSISRKRFICRESTLPLWQIIPPQVASCICCRALWSFLGRNWAQVMIYQPVHYILVPSYYHESVCKWHYNKSNMTCCDYVITLCHPKINGLRPAW